MHHAGAAALPNNRIGASWTSAEGGHSARQRRQTRGDRHDPRRAGNARHVSEVPYTRLPDFLDIESFLSGSGSGEQDGKALLGRAGFGQRLFACAMRGHQTGPRLHKCVPSGSIQPEWASGCSVWWHPHPTPGVNAAQRMRTGDWHHRSATEGDRPASGSDPRCRRRCPVNRRSHARGRPNGHPTPMRHI